MKHTTRVISDDSGSNSKFPKVFIKVFAPYKQKPEKSILQGLFDNKVIENSPEVQTTQAEAITVNKCTCKIEEDAWDLDEAAAILDARCLVCKIGINEVATTSVKIETEVHPAEDDFEEITFCFVSKIDIDEVATTSIKIEKEVQPAEDGFEEITLANCLTCNGPSRVCGCVDANIQLPFDHELDDHGFVDDSPTTVAPRKIRTLELEIDEIFDPMSDGCTDIVRRMSYAREPDERVEAHEVGYTFVDHHKKK